MKEYTHRSPKKMHAQKTFEKNLSLHAGLISEAVHLHIANLYILKEIAVVSKVYFSTKHCKAYKEKNTANSKEQNESLKTKTKETQTSDKTKI